MSDEIVHNWNRVMSLYESLNDHGWQHIPPFMELLPEIKKCAERYNLTPVTSHERLLLSKYPEYPDFFDKEHIIIVPMSDETILIEMWNQQHEKTSQKSYHRSESLPYILEAINEQFGNKRSV